MLSHSFTIHSPTSPEATLSEIDRIGGPDDQRHNWTVDPQPTGFQAWNGLGKGKSVVVVEGRVHPAPGGTRIEAVARLAPPFSVMWPVASVLVVATPLLIASRIDTPITLTVAAIVGVAVYWTVAVPWMLKSAGSGFTALLADRLRATGG